MFTTQGITQGRIYICLHGYTNAVCVWYVNMSRTELRRRILLALFHKLKAALQLQVVLSLFLKNRVAGDVLQYKMILLHNKW